MTELAGVGLGIVVGWTLPAVRRRTWLALVSSVVMAAFVVFTLYLLVGVEVTLSAAVGMAIGAWLHAAFIEYVTGRSTVSQGISKED